MLTPIRRYASKRNSQLIPMEHPDKVKNTRDFRCLKTMVVLPKDHPLAHADTFPVKSLQDDPFIMLEKGTKTEITENYQKTD